MDNNLNSQEATEQELDAIMEHMGFHVNKGQDQKKVETEESTMLDEIFKNMNI